jgi:hypothetical protein
VGGIVQNISSSREWAWAYLENCFNSGTILNSRYKGSIAGGIVATSGMVQIRNCYNRGSIQGNINGNILGEAWGSNTIINQCYSVGTIYGSYNTSYSVPVVTDCYTFDTSGNVATKGGTLLDALNEWVVDYPKGFGGNLPSLYRWKDTPYPVFDIYYGKAVTVTRNLNGGSGISGDVTISHNTAASLGKPTRTGHTFTGWWTVYSGVTGTGTNYDSNRDGTITAADASAIIESGVAALTLYAGWTVNTYTVRFNASGGTGTMADQSFTYGTAKSLTANTFSKEYFRFLGWATSQANADKGTVSYNNAQSVSNLTTTNGAVIDLYAVWGTNYSTYYLYFSTGASVEGNAGYVEPNVAKTLPTAEEMVKYAPPGKTFDGWYDNADFTGSAVTQVLITARGEVRHYFSKWV